MPGDVALDALQSNATGPADRVAVDFPCRQQLIPLALLQPSFFHACFGGTPIGFASVSAVVTPISPQTVIDDCGVWRMV
jgi:hypothetical protein